MKEVILVVFLLVMILILIVCALTFVQQVGVDFAFKAMWCSTGIAIGLGLMLFCTIKLSSP